MSETANLGFIGLGTMGEPMSLNLARSGMPLLVWNRSPVKCVALAKAGAIIAKDPSEVLARSDVIFFMLVDRAAMDDVLARGSASFRDLVKGRLLVNMGTPPPGYSVTLAAEIREAGGRYIEAPVSGSRKPAESGQLVAMLAGDPEDIASIRPLLGSMCRDAIFCGPIPNGLYMKLAVNLFMTAMVTGLAEAMYFAKRYGLDLSRFVAVLDASPMASDVSRVKAAKLLTGDFVAQAAISNVVENTRLIFQAAREGEFASPLLDICHSLFCEASALGLGTADMVAVIQAIERRTGERSCHIEGGNASRGHVTDRNIIDTWSNFVS